MASAAITISVSVATIESDSSGAVITKAMTGLCGYLYNLGPSNVFAKVIYGNGTAPAATDAATTLAQAQNQVCIPSGGWLRVTKQISAIAHETISGIAALSWQPDDQE